MDYLAKQVLVDGICIPLLLSLRDCHSQSRVTAAEKMTVNGALAWRGGTFQCRILGLCKQQTVNISLYQPAWRPSAPEGSIPQDGWFLTLISEWWRQNKSDKLASF